MNDVGHSLPVHALLFDLLTVDGEIENQQGVHYLIAYRLRAYADLIAELQVRARNFC